RTAGGLRAAAALVRRGRRRVPRPRTGQAEHARQYAHAAAPRPGGVVTRVGAIDCGTNSIRLLVADVERDRLTEVVRRMEIVRLGRGVDRTGRLSPEALERTRVALADYAAEIKALGADRVRAVATSATRDAANADEFRAMVVATLGVPPEVVTGAEEAHLSFT